MPPSVWTEPHAAGQGTAAGRPPETLRKRREFLAAARARRWATPGLILQGRPRREGEPAGGPRVGYTCSKKVGGSVERNRAKRRLRAAARTLIPRLGRAGWDYVLIGRSGTTIERPFDDLLDDLATALDRVHQPPRRRREEGARRQTPGAGE